MAFKPRINSQFNSQSGLGRPGGAMSKGSTPGVMKGAGSSFAAMENTLIKGAAPDPKALSGGGSGRQFFTSTAGGDSTASLLKPKQTKKLKLQ